ncbi:GGDEF domain-containing protein [Geodermatophilus sp. SYSU D00758]
MSMTGTAPPADRRSVFDNAPMGIAILTPDGVLVDANPVLGHMLGRDPAQLQSVPVLDLVHPDDIPAAQEAHGQLLALRGKPMRHETRLLHRDGSALPVQVTAAAVEEPPGAGVDHLVMIIEDITDRKALEAQLVHQSLHDPLTGLPNRILFRDRLRHALDRGRRERTPTCVIVIDLDGFKAINDEHGHHMGDLVLVAFAEKLTSVLRASDTAARLGGDEFSIVCENTERQDAEVLADRLRRSVPERLTLGGATVTLGMSIGIGSVPGGADPEEVYERLVRAADDAMYADKAARRR